MRTAFRRLTLGIRFARFLPALLGLLDSFVAMVASSLDLGLLNLR